MPVYNLASKILCRVINVSLKAEPDTDEVFAQVTLLPESNFSEWLCHTLLFFLPKRGRFAWLSLFQQVSGFLWLELQSTSFVADQKLPYLDFAGISTQLLQTLFKVKGVVHYGIAGNADPQLEIGDVTIPQFWAHSGLWNWQEVESNLSRFWNVLESKKLTQAVVSKLEEALWINNRKYDALWCWEMLKLLVHFALRTRMRQGFQKVLQCFLKAFNEFVQRRVSHYKELNPTENLLLLKAFCELQAQDRNRLKSNFCGLVLLLGSLPWRLNYQNLVFPHCRFQVVVAERIKLKEKKIKYTNELESKV
ncbi:uncharacterized protein LOC125471864 isoform X2 [Pyrus x bretschneideri]|uniref:uncharacterized protein LOC125471864 isoform X2 n=1 Tax=Pyrus x bretschneideri TaxID=225117 RepID=UPI00202DF0C4|nr:uncharacterized protein LOC125471864 isoform X2 [Pyrus x bretschneideri]